MSIQKIVKFKKICDILEIETKGSDDFERRLIIQKMFYFLQKLGLDLDIKYNFYKYGPYSPDLTDMYYSVLNLNRQKLEYFPDIDFSQKENEILIKLKKIFQLWGGNIKELEFYASVLYIYEDMYIKDQNKQKLIQVVRKFKPDLFRAFDIEKALRDLKTQGLLE